MYNNFGNSGMDQNGMMMGMNFGQFDQGQLNFDPNNVNLNMNNMNNNYGVPNQNNNINNK